MWEVPTCFSVHNIKWGRGRRVDVQAVGKLRQMFACPDSSSGFYPRLSHGHPPLICNSTLIQRRNTLVELCI
jgi:hypothetical protein